MIEIKSFNSESGTDIFLSCEGRAPGGGTLDCRLSIGLTPKAGAKDVAIAFRHLADTLDALEAGTTPPELPNIRTYTPKPPAPQPDKPKRVRKPTAAPVPVVPTKPSAPAKAAKPAPARKPVAKPKKAKR